MAVWGRLRGRIVTGSDVPAQSSLRLSALAAALLLASCATNAPPPPKPTAKGGYVDMGLAAQAGAFEAFTRKAAAIPAGFAGPDDIAQGLQAGAAYEPRQLEAGMIAYAALAALQEPAFVAGVRKAGGRDLARRLAAIPEAALDLPGGQAAAGRASAALARRGEALAQAGRRVKAASYSVQKQGWSKARLTNGPARLAEVKRISTAGYRATGDDRARLTAAIAEGGRRGGPSPVVARGVALAALTVMGQEGQGRALSSEPKSAMCLRMAKLNFHQCLASAGTHYEDIYCLGVHAMTDPGQCVVEATKPARIRRAAAD